VSEPEYPQSLKESFVEFSDLVNHDQEKLDANSNYEYDFGFNMDTFVDRLAQVDAVLLEEFWMKKFGPCYWSGIMSAYPWDQLEYGELSIWKLLLKYHTVVDQKNWVVCFKHNDESPIGKWLRQHTSDGDVPYNVRTLFRTAVKYTLEKYSESIWSVEPLVYCYHCMMSVALDEHGKCPECHKFPQPDEEEDVML